MVLYFSGDAGVPKIEPEVFFGDDSNVMLTFYKLAGPPHGVTGKPQLRRIKRIRKVRKSRRSDNR